MITLFTDKGSRALDEYDGKGYWGVEGRAGQDPGKKATLTSIKSLLFFKDTELRSNCLNRLCPFRIVPQDAPAGFTYITTVALEVIKFDN
jgi:hypothetical protein